MNARVDYAELERKVIGDDIPAAQNALRTESVTLLRGDEIEVQVVRWLWEGYLAQGKLTLLAGAPGSGKTTCAIKIAATISCGGAWPCSAQLQAPRDVVVWRTTPAIPYYPDSLQAVETVGAFTS
jgi:DNA polymerase III delta prime subunit